MSTTSRSRVVKAPASIASAPVGSDVSSVIEADAVAVLPVSSAKQTEIVSASSPSGTVHAALGAKATRLAQLGTPPSTIRSLVTSAAAPSDSVTSRSCV